MIHGKSTDRIQIKKIDLRLWTLSDEIDANIIHYKELLDLQENKNDETLIEKFKQLKAFYECKPISPLKANPVEPKSHLSLVKTPPPAVDDVIPTAEPVKNTDSENVNVSQDIVAPVVENLNAMPPSAAEESPKVIPPTLTVLPPIDHLQIRKNTSRLIPVPNKISNGFAILYDISFENILLFSNKNFLPGQHVMIEFLIPRSFAIVGEIIYTKEQGSSSRIISSHSAPYRLKIHFLHQHLGDTSLLRSFLQSVDHRIS